MQKICEREGCGKTYEAKRSDSRTCSSTCRGKLAQQAKAGGQVVPMPSAPAPLSDLAGVTRRRLEQCERLDTELGQLALMLAGRMDHSGSDSGASVASLSKEYHRVLEAALEGVAQAADPLDEFTKRLNAKRNAG